jgi:hypothetical protein
MEGDSPRFVSPRAFGPHVPRAPVPPTPGSPYFALAEKVAQVNWVVVAESLSFNIKIAEGDGPLAPSHFYVSVVRPFMYHTPHTIDDMPKNPEFLQSGITWGGMTLEFWGCCGPPGT